MVPSGHIFGIDDLTIGALLYAMAKGAVIGAAIGAGVAAATGGNIGQGALTGAVTGAITAGAFYGAGEIITGMEKVVDVAATKAAGASMAYAGTTVGAGTQAAIHAGAGAVAGGVSAAVTGEHVGMGALTGGISGGIGKYAGGFLPDDFVSQLGGRSLIGGVTGGISAELYGGSFGQGFGQGAMRGAFGYLFNACAHGGCRRVWGIATGPGVAVAAGAGAEVSTGIVTDKYEGQASLSLNVAAGVALGGSIFGAGWVYASSPSDIRGSVTVCAGIFSVTTYFDRNAKPIGYSVGIGPGLGIYVSGPVKIKERTW